MQHTYERANQQAYEKGQRTERKKGYEYGNSKSETNLYNVAHPHRTYLRHRDSMCWYCTMYIYTSVCLYVEYPLAQVQVNWQVILFYFIEHLFVCACIFFLLNTFNAYRMYCLAH